MLFVRTGIMHPKTEYEDSLCATPDSSFPPSPENVWPVNQGITRAPDRIGVPNGGWISESESEGENMEVATSREVRAIPEDFLVPRTTSLHPNTTPVVGDSSTATAPIHLSTRPAPAPTGEPSEDTVPLLMARFNCIEDKLVKLEEFRQEIINEICVDMGFVLKNNTADLRSLKEEMEELKADNKKIKEELLSKENRIMQLEEALSKAASNGTSHTPPSS